ncbi:uracil-DNA glycosylase family protein [Variovorax sp. J22P168]|uniref:uracil-DNA glycosylase family protein n=1 Tax=Variovorax jilinensis TaxID=3053513 RepID=UPI0025764640|nr:uracil-DNA glycosylase family protein [Variovorax sp. J22P168]MDM0014070.1 uracil-DNA glycosylase family protein [Variovorax sp. J22P168]
MTDALNLDARQRAMLDEMGIKLFWWRQAEAQPGPALPLEPAVEAAGVSPPRAEVRPVPVVAASPAVTAPAPVPASAEAPPATPRTAIPTQGAGVLAESPRRICGDASAPREGGWLIVADMPPGLDGRHGDPFEGDAGRLLHNMLGALQLHGGAVPVYLMRTHRGVASGQPGSPRPAEAALADDVAALAPRVLLALGPLAAQSLLQLAEPLGKLRGRVVPIALAGLPALPVVASYHPAYLLRNPADKGRAWADLCLAAEQVAPVVAERPQAAT